MTTQAVAAYGTTLTKGGSSVAEIKEINGVDTSGKTIDVTTLSSTEGFEEFILGTKNPGEVRISGFFYPGDTNGQAAMWTDYRNGDSDTYIITFPSDLGATWTFTAFVMSFKTGAVVDDAVSFEASLKISGAPSLGTTATTGASAIAFEAGGGGALTNVDLTPAYAIGTFYYALTFDTDTTWKITVTAASHTIKLYVDGTLTETLTTAVASTAVSISADISQEVKVIVWEDGKTPKTYTFMVARTA